jgi:uncharacterized protein (UPF0335 family)
MARSQGKGKNRIKLKISGFDRLIEELDELQSDVKTVLTEALEGAGEDVGVRTYEAMEKSNLPAKGKYSHGDTIKTVVMEPEVEWYGSIAEIGVGFDKVKNGVGNLLITGTPRMKPNHELEKIFVTKKYMKELNSQISGALTEAIKEKMEG